MPTSPSSERWLLPALFAVGAVIVNVTAWYVFDRFAGGMRQFGGPFDSPLFIAAIGAVGGAAFGHTFHKYRRLRQAAAEDPVGPFPVAAPESDVAVPDLPAFPDRVGVARRSTERMGDVEVDVMDLTNEVSDGDGGTMRATRTVAVLKVRGLPAFDLRPARFSDHFLTLAGAEGLRFDPAPLDTADDIETVEQFAAAYRLTTTSTRSMIDGTSAGDDDAVRRMFTLSVMRVVLGRSDWRVQCHGDLLACWEAPDALGPQRRAQLISDAAALRAALLAAHAGVAGDRVVPAPAGNVSSERQAARFQAAVLGALLGGFAGFFVGGILNAMEMFDQPPGQRRPVGGGRILVALVLGILGGGSLGALLPLRRPLLRKPTDARREKVVGCAVGVGLFGGFFVGFVAGAVLGQVLDWKFGDGGEVLLFGGMGVGALAGPILLGVATNWVYGWVTGRRS